LTTQIGLEAYKNHFDIELDKPKNSTNSINPTNAINPMHAEMHKPNWLFGGLMLLSVGVHLIVLIHLATIYQPNVVSRIELTLVSINSRPQPKIVAPAARPAQPQEAFDHQTHPKTELIAPIPTPYYQPPEPVRAERLRNSPAMPQIPNASDPKASVWEGIPALQPASVVPEPAPIKQETGLAEIAYIDHIKQRIDDVKEYPQRARRRTLEGEVTVLFTIGGGGELVSIRIADSSGSRILDRSAIKAVQKAAPFKVPPDGAVTVELPIKYQLTRSD